MRTRARFNPDWLARSFRLIGKAKVEFHLRCRPEDAKVEDRRHNAEDGLHGSTGGLWRCYWRRGIPPLVSDRRWRSGGQFQCLHFWHIKWIEDLTKKQFARFASSEMVFAEKIIPNPNNPNNACTEGMEKAQGTQKEGSSRGVQTSTRWSPRAGGNVCRCHWCCFPIHKIGLKDRPKVSGHLRSIRFGNRFPILHLNPTN